jgi:hypothetical protein
MNDLRALAERAESGSGADRELDALIDAALRIGPKGLPDWARANFPIWRGRPDGQTEVVHTDGTGGLHWESPAFSASIDAARQLLPWKPHPCANLKTNLVQSGDRGFYCFVEFTWPSTENQGRARDEARATLACALRAIQRTSEDLAPYQKTERKKS